MKWNRPLNGLQNRIERIDRENPAIELTSANQILSSFRLAEFSQSDWLQVVYRARELQSPSHSIQANRPCKEPTRPILLPQPLEPEQETLGPITRRLQVHQPADQQRQFVDQKKLLRISLFVQPLQLF